VPGQKGQLTQVLFLKSLPKPGHIHTSVYCFDRLPADVFCHVELSLVTFPFCTPKMPSRLITVIGSLNMDIVTVIDEVPDPGESITAVDPLLVCPGGKGANQAMAAFRLSRSNPAAPVMAKFKDSSTHSRIEVCMIGRVGDDAYGTEILKGFEAARLSTDGIEWVAGLHTGVAVILVESGSGESRVMLHPGANHSLRPSDFLTLHGLIKRDGQLLRKPDLLVLQLELHRDTVEQILETAGKEGVEVVLNAAPATSLMPKALKAVTHLIVNETEAAILMGEDATSLDTMTHCWGKLIKLCLNGGVKNLVVTLGPNGAYYWTKETGGDFWTIKESVHVVDTTTAGDTFVGAYAVEVLNAKDDEHWDIEKAVQRACKAATRCVTKKGTQNSIPWKNELYV
jgi:ribokinase